MQELNASSRDELIERVRGFGVAHAEVMTRAELIAELERRMRREQLRSQPPQSWVGRARGLLASVVEQGLNLPDAAAMIRGEVPLRAVRNQPPVPTVTLAQIYAAQGHLARAVSTLDQVLASEPEHKVAEALKQRILDDIEKRDELRNRVTVGPPRKAQRKEQEAEGISTAADVADAEDAPTEDADAEEAVVPAADVAPGQRDCVLVIRSSKGPQLFWQLSAETEALRRAKSPPLVVSWVAFKPDPSGPKPLKGECSLDDATGRVALAPASEATEYRAALGLKAPGGFQPLFVASTLDARGSEPVLLRLGSAHPTSLEGPIARSLEAL